MEFTRFKDNATSMINFATTRWTGAEMKTQDTFMEEVQSYTTFKVADFVNTFWFPVLIPIGLVGNMLSFLVMIKQNNRKMSTCIYMASISINDNFVMYVCLHDYLVSSVQIDRCNPRQCKFIAFMALSALQNSTFQVLAMTLDKYIAIKWPHRAATYSTPRRAKVIAMSLYICVFVYNVPHFFLSGIIGCQCIALGSSSLITKMYSWFSFVLNAVIPFTLLIHMNYIIMKTVRNSRKLFKENDTNTGMEARQKTMKSAEKQVTIMLLLVTTLFLILLCPTYVRFIYLVFAKRDTPFEYASSMLFFQVTYKLYSSNSRLNFFFYCISGQKFRNDLKQILLLCCCGICCPCRTMMKDGSQTTTSETNSVHTKSSSSLTS